MISALLYEGKIFIIICTFIGGVNTLLGFYYHGRDRRANWISKNFTGPKTGQFYL
jgi:hypothetical protein